MLLWLALAVITAATLVAVLAPVFGKARAEDASAADADHAVYRAQLSEIEVDVDRGLIEAGEADAARTEIARRLLASDAAARGSASARLGADGDLAARSALAVAALLPVAAVATYLAFGTPGLPAQPFAARKAAPAETAQVADLIARVEKRLREKPEDGRGWEVIAPVYARLGRFADATQAYRHAVRLLGDSPERLRGLGESLVMGNNGIVGEEARAAFTKLTRIEPADPLPQFWLAVAEEQDGRTANAVRAYRGMLSRAPPEAAWRPLVAERLAALKQSGVDIGGDIPTGPPAVAAPRGPSEADVAAAQSMSDKDKAAMINQMVAGLAERLKTNGRDLSGWTRLVRAYVVLGRRQDAQTALADARRIFEGEAAALASLTELARSLGLDS